MQREVIRWVGERTQGLERKRDKFIHSFKFKQKIGDLIIFFRFVFRDHL